jgi:hypothetical protein
MSLHFITFQIAIKQAMFNILVLLLGSAFKKYHVFDEASGRNGF